MTNENNEYLEPQNRFNKHFIFGEEQNDTEYSSFDFDFANYDKNIDEQSHLDFDNNLNEFNSAFSTIFPNFEIKKTKTKIFEVIHRERISVFTNIENEENDSSIDDTFLKRKRYPEKRRRFENQDNMRKKIKRGFLNKALIKNINENLKNIESKLYLEKFPQKLVCDITKKSNKNILDMSLKQIFEKKELYDDSDLNKYYHNLKVIKSKQIQENVELKSILNKKYFELFEEYINSKEFKVDEINQLKEKKMENSYIERYIYLAKHFIEFFSE
jgi:hypothetical protein